MHRLIVKREVRADLCPCLAAVCGAMHVLAAYIHDVVIVRRNGEGIGPVHPYLDFAGIRAHGAVGPYADGAREARLGIEAFGDARVATSPNDVVIDWIGYLPSCFASRSRSPFTGADTAFAGDVAGAMQRRAVLHLAVDHVRDTIV